MAAPAGAGEHPVNPSKVRAARRESCEDGTNFVNSLWSLDREEHQPSRRDVMGDKGGKKDKEKVQKQKSDQQKEKTKVKQEKQPKKKV
jgi:hypothetical protein